MTEDYAHEKEVEILDKLNCVAGVLRQNGITHFAYNEFHVQGKYSIWCTNVEWMKFYFQHENFKLNFNSMNQRLSPREIQCLSLLAQAKTAKEIGEVLTISPRTVESYFQDIKNKFNLQNRSDLVELYEAIQSMAVY